MGFPHQCGDKFTYWIRTEREDNVKDVFLKRRTVRTRRINIRGLTEYVNDNLMEAEFILIDGEHNRIDYEEPSSENSGESITNPPAPMDLSDSGDIGMLASAGGTPYLDPGTREPHQERQASINEVSNPTTASINKVQIQASISKQSPQYNNSFYKGSSSFYKLSS